MRVAIVQTSPVLGAVDKNIARATSLLASLPPSQLDLIVLPELAFTGYNFQSPKQITPYVETQTTSPSREWAVRMAREYRCSVLLGLPTQKDGNRHNAAVMVDSTGETVHEYYKHHLFETDYKWGCTAGAGSWSTPSKTAPGPLARPVEGRMDACGSALRARARWGAPLRGS